MKHKVINKKVTVSTTFEIEDSKINNGIVYLKITDGNNRYKWIKYAFASDDSDDLK